MKKYLDMNLIWAAERLFVNGKFELPNELYMKVASFINFREWALSGSEDAETECFFYLLVHEAQKDD